MKVVILSDVIENEEWFIVCEAKRPYEYIRLFTNREEALSWCDKQCYDVTVDLEGVI